MATSERAPQPGEKARAKRAEATQEVRDQVTAPVLDEPVADVEGTTITGLKPKTLHTEVVVDEVVIQVGRETVRLSRAGTSRLIKELSRAMLALNG